MSEVEGTYVREKLGIAGCRLVIRVDRERIVRGERRSYETRYYITSLDPARVSPQQLLRWIRGHWEVENSLHYVKDRWWDEDRHSLRRPGLPGIWATLTNAAINVLRLMRQVLLGDSPKSGRKPLRAIAEQAHWRLQDTLKILGFPVKN